MAAPDKSWEVALWGKNLANKLVATYVTVSVPSGVVSVVTSNEGSGAVTTTTTSATTTKQNGG